MQDLYPPKGKKNLRWDLNISNEENDSKYDPFKACNQTFPKSQ